MTETEWLTCQLEPYKMLEALRFKGSARKRRLYACACCRVVWELLTDERSRKAVVTAERYADGMANEQDLADAERGARAARDMARAAVREARRLMREAAPEARREAISAQDFAIVAANAAGAAAYCCATGGYEPSANVDYYNSVDESAVLEVVNLLIERPGYIVEGFVEPLRDLFSNPFRPVVLDPAWLTTTVVRLARTLSEETHQAEGSLDATGLAVLADALEEAGCTDTEVLSHCRNPGHHFRGCWVLDLVLAKEELCRTSGCSGQATRITVPRASALSPARAGGVEVILEVMD
jgi:hypothetical protein